MATNPHMPETGLFKTLYGDVRQGGFWKSLKQDWRELKQFYLDREREKRLKEMGWLRRTFYLTVWLIKSLLMKLNPFRRLVLFLGLILIFFSTTITWQGQEVVFRNDSQGLGGMLILFVLMLELKDKLLARSELTAGRQIQFALMPPESPAVPGWDIWLFTRPANDVGGDLLDFQQITPDRFSVALGDVSGKGLPAALLMAKLQATLRALAPDVPSLEELGARVNRTFYRDGLRSKFASLVYLEILPGEGNIRLINAGHMPPLVCTGGKQSELPKGEPALGLAETTRYVEKSYEMPPGSWMLVYSDGLTEAQNEAGQFFGEQRLREFFTGPPAAGAKETGRMLLQQVGKFIGEAPIRDDLTLVILKRCEH